MGYLARVSTFLAVACLLGGLCFAASKSPTREQTAYGIRKIRIATPYWEDFTNKDGTGVYFDLLRAVYEPMDVRVKYELVPWKRAELMIRQQDADAGLAEFYNPDYEPAILYPRYPMDSEIVCVVYKKERFGQWHGQESLKNKKVAWIRGYDYHKNLGVKVKYYEVDSQKQAWGMMDIDRVDCFMASIEEIENYMSEHDISSRDYPIQEVITKQLYMWFNNSQRSRTLIDIYDQQIPRLLESGVLERIFKRYQVNMPKFQPRTP